MRKQIKFFQSCFLSFLDTDVTKFIEENSAIVVDCQFKILQADLPKRCQFTAMLVYTVSPNVMQEK